MSECALAHFCLWPTATTESTNTATAERSTDSTATALPSSPTLVPTLPPTLTPLPELTPPVAKTEPDLIVKQAVLDQGYGIVDAEYMARTSVVFQQIDTTTWRVLMATPTGHLIEQTIQYSRGLAADIDTPIQFAPTSVDTPDAFAYSYTVSAADAPQEILDALGTAPIARYQSHMMRINPPVQVAVDVDAVLVNINGFIKQYAKDKVGDFTKEMDKLIDASADKVKINDMWNALKAGLYVKDAFWMFEKV